MRSHRRNHQCELSCLGLCFKFYSTFHSCRHGFIIAPMEYHWTQWIARPGLSLLWSINVQSVFSVIQYSASTFTNRNFLILRTFGIFRMIFIVFLGNHQQFWRKFEEFSNANSITSRNSERLFRKSDFPDSKPWRDCRRYVVNARQKPPNQNTIPT